MNINNTLCCLNVGLPEDIQRRKNYGDFDGAIRLIDRRLADEATPEAMRNALLAQKEICRRLPEDFPYSREEAIALVREHISDFTEEEFDELVDDRRIRWIYINGEMRFFDRFFSSVCKAMPSFAHRAGMQLSGVESDTGIPQEKDLLDVTIEKMKENGSLSYRIRVRASVRLKDEQFSPGMFIRAHLPIPAPCPQQTDICIEKLFPENGRIAPEDAPQRTICWEETMEENHAFVVEYSYLHTARYHDAYHGTGKPASLTCDIREQEPHIVFTPYIRALCDKLTEGMTDPLEKARAFYDFITLNMQYTYMPSYFVLERIAESCAQSFTGDCGVFALLFITLCRCAGIPAQWQSGLTAEPDYIGCHDWARFYAEPYGWLFADPSYGIAAVRKNKEYRRRFYFGNLDPFRMVANSAFQEDFTVSKEHWRSDPYDNQSGEIETADRGFRSEEYVRTKEILLCEEV